MLHDFGSVLLSLRHGFRLLLPFAAPLVDSFFLLTVGRREAEFICSTNKKPRMLAALSIAFCIRNAEEGGMDELINGLGSTSCRLCLVPENITLEDS
jgi:hypothetical protein